jgi:3-hydroxybutyrate dehydrogenase
MAREQSYKGKLAIITGGSSGLGLAMAHRLAALGAKPVLIDITLHETPYPLEIADVGNAEALSAATTRIAAKFGQIDLAISNAAIDLTGEAHTFTVAEWQAIINTNLIGATNLISAIYPGMVARQAGQLLFIASGAGLIGFPFGAPYTASKAGLIGLGKALRAEAKAYGVKVNVACPPILQTPLLENGQAKAGVDRPAFMSSLTKRPMPADEAARRILDGAASNKAQIIFPQKLTIGHKLATLFPTLGHHIRQDILKKFNKYGRK